MGLEASGDLSIQAAAGTNRNIALEEDGNNTGDKSLSTLAASADTIDGLDMTDWHSYESTPGTPTSVSGLQIGAACDPGQITVTWTAATPSTEDRFRSEYNVNSAGWTFGANTAGSPSGGINIGTVSPEDVVETRVRAERTDGGNQVSGYGTDSTDIIIACPNGK